MINKFTYKIENLNVMFMKEIIEYTLEGYASTTKKRLTDKVCISTRQQRFLYCIINTKKMILF